MVHDSIHCHITTLFSFEVSNSDSRWRRYDDVRSKGNVKKARTVCKILTRHFQGLLKF